MSIAVTGATGHFGRLTVEALLRRGVPADQIIATGRRIETLGDLAGQGVSVRRADYSDEASLRQALAGADRLLLVSGTEVGQRIKQHTNVITAAKAAGVQLIAYTSIVHAPTSTLLIGQEHRGTEKALADSGVPHVLLRNSWYIDNYTAQLPAYLQHGIVGAAADGPISGATRADYAEAAAASLAEDGHGGALYEVGGPAFTMAELAEVVSAETGASIKYTDLSVQDYQAFLVRAGLPEPVAASIADGDRAVAEGELYVDPADLEKLLGRPASPLRAAVAAAVRDLR
ncbi:MAG TPA: SDR family oxidoreductase [Propionibacteriaceae bacterium]|nr:SDR family oxidoreductase [Propionibacteriaceae bacterium]